MYQPSVPTSAAPRTHQQPAPARKPKWQLAGREVNQAMFYEAEKAKRAGKRVIFVSAGTTHMGDSADDCPNCEGFGQFALEILIKGPFKTPPPGKQGDEGNPVHLRPAWHNGAWYLVVRDIYLCPVCTGKDELPL